MYAPKLRSAVLALGCALAYAAGANAQHGYTRQIQSGGTANLQTPASPAATSGPELDPALAGGDTHDGGNDATGYTTINRSVNTGGKSGSAHANGSQKAKSNPEIGLSFDGLNFFQQRYVADNGNQFSVEPPDQGLCAGNGYILESTNDVLNIFNTSGASVLPGGKPLSLNQFYGYPSAINRSTLKYGPELTDPSCYFDKSTQRWFHVVLTLDRVGTSSHLSGTNHLDLAVSQTANPLGNWTIYRIPVQDDGSQGTPNHNCPGPCLGDYPHIGADDYGIYLTTNEFPFFANGFHGAQIYAISKQALAANAPSVNVVQYDTSDPSTNSASGGYGFTIWPAISAQSSPTEQGGTEYMLSSLAILTDSGVSNQLQLWSLTGTSALSTGGAPTLVSSLVNTEYYGIPGSARQPGTGTNGVGKAPGGGNVDWPLGQCLNDTTCATTLNGAKFPHTEVISDLAANDSRMQQVYYANGKLWASLGTGIAYATTPQTYSEGLAYFVLHPQSNGGTPTASVVQQGYVAAPDLDVTYGTVAVTESGRGVLSFTATGPSNYPGVGYTSLDAKIGAGPIHISTPGLGAQDGFSGYVAENYPNPRRPRWGDYGAAVVDGNSIWFAQEYIGQSCSLAQYESAPFGRCVGASGVPTRGVLGNWYTRITKASF